MRVVITGGRANYDRPHIWKTLNTIHAATPITLLCEGDADGVDRIAGRWADTKGVQHVTCHANWTGQGDSAGTIRNTLMLDLIKPDVVVAFAGGRGTTNMMLQAKKQGIRLIDAENKEYRT